MAFIKGREKYGQVRSGQRWMKRDNGMKMTVLSKQKGDAWRCVFDARNPNSSHKLKEMVIYKYYDRVA